MKNFLRILIGAIVMTSLMANAADHKKIETVQDLMAAYAWYNDLLDIDENMKLFLDDATVHSVKSGLKAAGHDEVKEYYSGFWDRVEHQRRHLITGVRVYSEEGDTIRFYATFGVLETNDEGSKVAVAGYYDGVVVRTEDGLRFSHLEVGSD